MYLGNCGAFLAHRNLDTTEDRLYANAPVAVIGTIKRAGESSQWSACFRLAVGTMI